MGVPVFRDPTALALLPDAVLLVVLIVLLVATNV